jgi:hypothetical protein
MLNLAGILFVFNAGFFNYKFRLKCISFIQQDQIEEEKKHFLIDGFSGLEVYIHQPTPSHST